MIGTTAAILGAAGYIATTNILVGKNARAGEWLIGYILETGSVAALAFVVQCALDGFK